MRISLTLGLLAALQLVVALASQLIILRTVGIGWQTDAYIAAQAVPLIITAVVAASLQNLWLPRFSRAAEDAYTWSSELGIALGQTLKVMLILTLPLCAASSLWAPVAFPGFSVSQQKLLVEAGNLLFVAAGLKALEGLLTVALRSTDRFILPEALSLITSLAVLAGIAMLVPDFGVIAAAWLSVVRGFIVVSILLLKVEFPKIRFISSHQSSEVEKQVRPLIAAGVFTKSSPLIDRYWGSQGNSGDITLLSLAQLAITSIAAIIERALLAKTLPGFARRLKEGGRTELKRAYYSCIRKIFFVVIAVAIALLIARPFWDIVCYYILQMSPNTAWQFWIFCLILLPTLYVTVAASASVAVFYTFGETRIPALIGVFGFVISIVLKSILFKFFGIIGIAIGTSLYLIINMLLHHTYAVNRLSGDRLESKK